MTWTVGYTGVCEDDVLPALESVKMLQKEFTQANSHIKWPEIKKDRKYYGKEKRQFYLNYISCSTIDINLDSVELVIEG